MARAPLIDEKIDLFSNAVSGNGQVNTCDNFLNMLPEPCNMQDVEVCVKQITIPTSWDPIPHHHRDTTRFRWIVKFSSEVVNFQKVLLKTLNGLAKDITALSSLSNRAFTTRQKR